MKSLKYILGVLSLCFALPSFADQCGVAFKPACPAVPSTPVPNGGQTYGFNLSGLGNLDVNNGVPRSTILAEIAKSNAKVIRTNINWGYLQTQKTGPMNAYYLGLIDAEHSDLAAQGVKQIMVVMGTPYWALDTENKGYNGANNVSICTDPGNGPEPHNCFAPVNVDDAAIQAAWKTYLQWIVTRYPDLAGIEIWNEPNSVSFWGKFHNAGVNSTNNPKVTYPTSATNPNPYQDADRMAKMLATAADAVHQVAPNIPVLSPGFSIVPQPSGNFPDMNYLTWLQRMYTTAGSSKFDAISTHLYPCNGGPGKYTAWLDTWTTAIRNVRNSNADALKPMWITETGASGSNLASNCGTSFTEQEQQLAIAYTLDWMKAQNATKKDIPVVLVHTLFNNANRTFIQMNNDSVQSGYGLIAWSMNANGNPSLVQEKVGFSTVSCKFKGSC